MKANLDRIGDEVYLSISPETIDEMTELIILAKNHKQEKPGYFYYGLGTQKLEISFGLKKKSENTISADYD